MKTKMILFLSIACAFIGCKPRAKDYTCNEYSLDCELKKDRILILPISIDSNIIDAYGQNVLHEQKKYGHQWYIIGTKARALVPVGIPVCISIDGGGNCVYDYHPSLEKIQRSFRGMNEVCVDTVNLSFFVKGLTKVAIIVSGPNEISSPQMSSIRWPLF